MDAVGKAAVGASRLLQLLVAIKMIRAYDFRDLKLGGRMVRKRPTAHDGSFLASQVSIILSAVFGLFTLAFLMWNALGADQIQCSKAGLIVLIFGLGTGLSASLIGGYASAKGPVLIPQLGIRPISVALGGGFLGLVIAIGLGWFVIRNNCVEIAGECDARVSFNVTRINCGKVFKLLDPPKEDGFLSVRTGPTDQCASKRGDQLHNDDQIIVLATRDKWLYVKRYTGRPIEGWSYGDYIETIECPPNAPKE